MQISRPETNIVKFRTKCALTRPQSQVPERKSTKMSGSTSVHLCAIWVGIGPDLAWTTRVSVTLSAFLERSHRCGASSSHTRGVRRTLRTVGPLRPSAHSSTIDLAHHNVEAAHNCRHIGNQATAAEFVEHR